MRRNWNSTVPNRSRLQTTRRFGLRIGPAEELYGLKHDPHQMLNVAGSTAMAEASLRGRLFDHLSKTRDPRVVGGQVDWDDYPYYGKISTKGWRVDEKPR